MSSLMPPSKSLNHCASVSFSQQYILRNAKLSWINGMAFALSPLSLDRFPFRPKINSVVENIHSTATDEALLASTVFATVFQVLQYNTI